MPVKETRVLLRVGSPITLRCHLAVGAGDVPQAEWTKGSQLLRSGPKYIISSQHGSMPSTLLISDPVRDDVGRYHCIFRHRDSGTTACIFIFHVYTIPCPSLFPPDHGAKLQCPHNPVYGESCTFSCRAGRRLSHSRPLVCEKFDGGGDTYWSDAVPKCHRISAEEDALLQENEVPFSMSHVLLRVGSTQTLQCNHPGTWTKDNGIVISGSGNKYTVEHSSLIIHNTQKGDSGLYECHIRHPSAAGLMGIKKYNVTTISCPRTLTPKNGVSTGCTSQPVYGETCRFRCNRGFRLTGSRSRTCDLADSQMHVYWTGNTPMCKGPRFPQKNSALAGEGGHSEQAADHSLLSSIPSCHEATSRRGFLILLILLPSLFCVSCLST
ncbi:hypothetical protein CAPTEDRAFT_228003 [Capitella teleta]|uniref:Ig-like domain-containing protein n=1 Tax=Capitella teleta TaxID=283909 RepID=R7U5V0_CAPTE|nr:hypothetical protein CAPTEDRAFT_228003 [Capitella teleta]|eukprot:ELU01359.1 hypothetical protein CAPTEDRAFT_228003 [Capitella teleta]